MKLEHRFEIEIQKPRQHVIELFSNRDLLSKWQRGLLTSEPLPATNGHPNYKLTFQLGKRKMIMTETIVRNELPEHYIVNYKMRGMNHTIENAFYILDSNSTKWVTETEFRFSGLMHLIAGFMKPGFEQQSQALMRSFKIFAESYH